MRFIFTFALTALLLSSAFYGFILAVDPYNKFGYNPFGFETKAVDFARENKFNQIEYTQKKYDVFLLGSSMAHRYQTKEINRLTGMTSYNYSTQSATPEDYISIVRHIIAKQDPKLIILVLDFEALNEHFATDDMFYSSPLKQYLTEAKPDELEAPLLNNSYLTLEALGDSLKVVWVNLFSEARHAYLEDGDHVVDPVKAKTVKVKQYTGGPFKFNQRRLEYLRTIKALGDKHGFKIIVISPPLSIEHYNRIKKDPPLFEKLEESKRILADIFGEVHDFTNESMAHFNDVKYFRDSNHPTHYFSTLILERVFGQDREERPENFGKVIKR